MKKVFASLIIGVVATGLMAICAEKGWLLPNAMLFLITLPVQAIAKTISSDYETANKLFYILMSFVNSLLSFAIISIGTSIRRKTN